MKTASSTNIHNGKNNTQHFDNNKTLYLSIRHHERCMCMRCDCDDDDDIKFLLHTAVFNSTVLELRWKKRQTNDEKWERQKKNTATIPQTNINIYRKWNIRISSVMPVSHILFLSVRVACSTFSYISVFFSCFALVMCARAFAIDSPLHRVASSPSKPKVRKTHNYTHAVCMFVFAISKLQLFSANFQWDHLWFIDLRVKIEFWFTSHYENVCYTFL